MNDILRVCNAGEYNISVPPPLLCNYNACMKSLNPNLDHSDRMDRVLLSFYGLAVGDAFGERFFRPDPQEAIRRRQLPQSPWKYTDDTAMARSVVTVLRDKRKIDPDLLAKRFGAEYFKNPMRGYGNAAHKVLTDLGRGMSWRHAASTLFGGQGSMGNGGGMRAGPIGAYFADDLDAVVQQAGLSAKVTHAHPEGQAGAIAVAVAAAAAEKTVDRGLKGSWQFRGKSLLEISCSRTPEGATRRGLEKALALPFETPVSEAVEVLGNGERVTAPDTIPFAIWCAARHLDDFKEAMWETVSGLGDRDTTCAIVGSIVPLARGWEGLPTDWYRMTEDVIIEVGDPS